MGNESFDVSLRAIINRTTKVDQHIGSEHGTKTSKLDKATSFLSPQQPKRELETRPKQLTSLLVVESNERLKAWYHHLEGRYFESVVNYEEIKTLVNSNDHSPTAGCIIFEIKENRYSDTAFVTSLLENYPMANVIITVPRNSTTFFSDIVAYSSKVSVLERPFSMANLVTLVRNLKSQESWTAKHQ